MSISAKVCAPLLSALASLFIAGPSQADTVAARCDVYPKGDDKATWSGPCNFSQRQGYVSIELKNGTRYEFSPGEKPGQFTDQDGKPVYRQSGLGSHGQIYRLTKQSLFIYWDPAPYQDKASSSGHGQGNTPTVNNANKTSKESKPSPSKSSKESRSSKESKSGN